jgi:hypothetical protein
MKEFTTFVNGNGLRVSFDHVSGSDAQPLNNPTISSIEVVYFTP